MDIGDCVNHVRADFFGQFLVTLKLGVNVVVELAITLAFVFDHGLETGSEFFEFKEMVDTDT